MKPFAAAILSSLWKCSGTNAFNPNPTWFYNSVGEYNWVSPFTFGKASLRRLVRASAEFNPWVQEDWTVQNGYRRDRWFRNRNAEGFFNRIPDMPAYHRNTSEYRKLIDCLSVQHDEPIWDIISTQYVSGEWTNHEWTTHGGMGNRNLAGEEWNAIVDEFVIQCRDAGYEPYES